MDMKSKQHNSTPEFSKNTCIQKKSIKDFKWYFDYTCFKKATFT